MGKSKVLKDLNYLINKLLENPDQLKKFKLSLADFRELQTVQCELKTIGHSETINSNVNEICMYCGLKSQSHGIGWKIFSRPSV